MCRGRSPGSRVVASVRPSRRLGMNPVAPVTRRGPWLAAHSYGGSSGIGALAPAPNSLLAPAQGRAPGNLDNSTRAEPDTGVNRYKDIFMKVAWLVWRRMGMRLLQGQVRKNLFERSEADQCRQPKGTDWR